MSAAIAARRRASHLLYIAVLIAVALGALLGYANPKLAVQMKPLADGFINLVKMLIAPIIFVTIVVGIGRLTNLGEVGRVGVKAMVYFEVMTTIAILTGLIVGHVLHPGAGVGADIAKLDVSPVSKFIENSQHQSVVGFLLAIVPDTLLGPFTRGDILPVLLIALLFGFALARTGARGRGIVHGLDSVGAVLFGILRIIMYIAPLGAFGGMAYSVGQFGIQQLANLAVLMIAFYLTGIVFVVGLLGLVLAACGLSILRLFGYLWDEFLLVLGTSSSETALPALMAKLERLGCGRSLVGLVVPLGYAFNLDGTSIYFTLAITYIAQALGIPLSWGDYAVICGVLLLTSKGAAAVTGGGFITLAATLTALSGKVPVGGIVLVFAVDRFMSEGRAIFNLFGNAVATIVVSRWEGTLDLARARDVLAGRPVADIPAEPAAIAV